jgi:hypothetical protein
MSTEPPWLCVTPREGSARRLSFSTYIYVALDGLLGVMSASPHSR